MSEGVNTVCPPALTVVGLGGDDSHVAGCMNCLALFESIEREAVTGNTMEVDLDCKSVRALVTELSFQTQPTLQALAPLYIHSRACASCRAMLAGHVSPTSSGSGSGPGFQTTALAPVNQLAQGETLGRFQITGRLGEGGMGVVVSAYDPNLDRSVAIKVVHQKAFRGKRADQAEMRLFREAQAMAKIRHPNVITVYEVGKVDDQVFIAMEQVHGSTLGRWLKEAPRTWQEILTAFRAAGEGLAAAHAAGLIHRDFKPDNVLVDNAGGIFVTDFGLVVADGADGPASRDSPFPHAARAPIELSAHTPIPALMSSLTQTGELLGTPKYMAPEQHQGHVSDARTDQFSFCVALYEALYGVLPFAGATYFMLVANVCNGVLTEPPKSTSVPDWIRPILLRGLSPSPADRFDSMKELLERLEIPSTRRRTGFIAAVAGGAVVVASIAAIVAIRSKATAAPQLCEGAEQQLAGIWDGPSKAAVREAFTSKGQAYALDTFARLDPLVSAYKGEWVAMHTEACKAARVFGSESEEMLDRRVSCLDRRRYGLQALIGLWREADQETIANAITSVRKLPPISECSAGTLAASSEAAIVDPEKKHQLEALQVKLATVEALLHTGKYKAGIRLAKEIQQAAEALGVASFTAETLLVLGELEWRAGEMKGSVGTLELAYDAAEAAGSPRLKALSGIELTYVYAAEVQNFEEAHKWAGRSRASIQNQGGDKTLEAGLLRNVGIAQNKSGKYQEAIESFQTSLEMREGIYGPNHIEVALSLSSLAVPMINAGDAKEALPLLTRAIKIAEQEYGKEHPELGDLYNNLGAAYASVADPQQARTHYLHSLALQENALGPDHVKLADVLTNLGALSFEAGDAQAAVSYIERAAKLEEKNYGPMNSGLGATLTHLASVRQSQGLHAEALTLARRAIAIHREAKHPNLLIALSLAAESAYELAKQEWKDEAKRSHSLELAREALADLQELDNDPDEVAEIEDWLAERTPK